MVAERAGVPSAWAVLRLSRMAARMAGSVAESCWGHVGGGWWERDDWEEAQWNSSAELWEPWFTFKGDGSGACPC